MILILKKNIVLITFQLKIFLLPSLPHLHAKPKKKAYNHLGGGPVIKAWDQEVCFLCSLRFEPCDCSYDGHWRLTWSGLVEVRANWPEYLR